MTNIDVINKKGKYIIDMNGHSGESEVCAAVSTLTAALEGWLKNSSLKYSYMEGKGVARIEAPKAAKEAVEVFLIGAMRLEKNFPDNVRVRVH